MIGGEYVVKSCYSCTHLSDKDCGKIKSMNYNGGVIYEKIPRKCKGYEVKKWGYSKEPKK